MMMPHCAAGTQKHWGEAKEAGGCCCPSSALQDHFSKVSNSGYKLRGRGVGNIDDLGNYTVLYMSIIA